MRVVYPICCGIDVHKSFLVATIIKTEGITPLYSKKRFSTFNKSILHLKQWLINNNCYDVCMESTGKYWIPVYNLLEDVINVTVASPKWVKAVKGNKDDEKDSKWIGDLFRLGLVPSSFIPVKPIRILREYTRYRVKLVGCRSSEKNRFQNSYTVCNVSLDSVVSDMFGVSASAITRYLLETDVIDPEHIKSLLKRSLKKKSDEVIQSIEGYEISPFQNFRIRLILNHIAFIQDEIQKIDSKVDEMVSNYEDSITLLCSIPGVKRSTAISIISEIGTDMSQFDSSKRLCAWAGLAPSNNQSAGKKKSVRISRAGVYLKPALVQAAHAAVKDKDSPYYKMKYQQISKRRGKKRAIIAIARMMLTAAYHMLKTSESWNPSDLFKIDMPVSLHEKQREKAIRCAVKLLVSQGLLNDIDIPDAQ